MSSKVISLIHQFGLNWSEPIASLMTATEIMVLELNFLSIDCLTPENAVTLFSFHAMVLTLGLDFYTEVSLRRWGCLLVAPLTSHTSKAFAFGGSLSYPFLRGRRETWQNLATSSTNSSPRLFVHRDLHLLLLFFDAAFDLPDSSQPAFDGAGLSISVLRRLTASHDGPHQFFWIPTTLCFPCLQFLAGLASA